jgi:deoxyribodipyrimidine photolyase
MKVLYIENNLVHVKSWLKVHPDAQVVFRPRITSNLLQAHAKRLFTDLCTFHPRVQVDWDRELNPSAENENYFCGWDSFDEQQFSSGMTRLGQNRLFSCRPCSIPDGFTAFRKKIEPLLPDFFEDAVPSLNEFHQETLERYFTIDDRASHYFETRNAMIGEENSTRFSVALSWGSVDVREIYNQVKLYERRKGANKSTYWIVFELLWREFFYWHYQKWQTRYFAANGLRGAAIFSTFPQYTIAQLRETISIPFMKACLNELEQTGYLTNRARQIFASLWLNELSLNWRSGALLFEEHLLDYDVYSNWGNWMYLAGLGVDPRGKRIFDLKKQLSTYDPQGLYLRKWLKDND